MDETFYESRESMPWYQSNDLDQEAADAALEHDRGIGPETEQDRIDAAIDEAEMREQWQREQAERAELLRLRAEVERLRADAEADRIGTAGMRAHIRQLEGLLHDLTAAWGGGFDVGSPAMEVESFYAAVEGVVDEWRRMDPDNQG